MKSTLILLFFHAFFIKKHTQHKQSFVPKMLYIHFNNNTVHIHNST